MLRIGLTGGIGSGKSTVARIFNVLGIPVYSSDDASKRLMNEDEELKKIFTPIAIKLKESEAKINSELIAVQGHAVAIGGYYEPTEKLVSEAMRPSKTFNTILSEIK